MVSLLSEMDHRVTTATEHISSGSDPNVLVPFAVSISDRFGWYFALDTGVSAILRMLFGSSLEVVYDITSPSDVPAVAVRNSI